MPVLKPLLKKRARAPKKTVKQKARTIQVEKRATEEMRLAAEGVKAKDMADLFGISRTRVHQDFNESLKRWQASRLAMASLVFDDHLHEIDRMIAQIAARLYVRDADGTSTDALNSEMVSLYYKYLQERAKLLNLYPAGQEGEGNKTTINQFYLSFGQTDDPAPVLPVHVIPGRALAVDADANSAADDDVHEDSA